MALTCCAGAHQRFIHAPTTAPSHLPRPLNPPSTLPLLRSFWPATVAYPVAMYIRKHNPKGRQRALLHFVDLFSLLVSILAVIGSVRSLFGGSPATPDYTAFDDVVPSGDTFADVMN